MPFRRLIAAAAATAFLAGPLAAAAPAERIAAGYVTQEHDTLVDLALRFDLGYLELLAANPGTDPWLPGAGREITIPNTHLLPDAPREGVVVNIGDMRLYYFPGKGKPVQSYPIGIGRDGFDIPLGRLKITAKRERPTWVPPASVKAEKPELPDVVPPGPDNPLGDYALNLGSGLYRIHGTNLPYGVGRRVSHGCIRMYPADIEALFRQVTIGTPVTVIDQPVKAAWIDGELYVDAHPAGGQLEQLEDEFRFEPYLDGDFEERIAAAAGEEIERVVWWRAFEVGQERTGVPTRVTGEVGAAVRNPVAEAPLPPLRPAPLHDQRAERLSPSPSSRPGQGVW